MRLLHRVAVLLLLPTALRATEASPLAWANGLRGAAAGALRPDARLSAAARAYAGELAEAGVLGHVGPADGSGPLERCFRAGATAFEVAEILGAGPDLGAVERAWEASPEHRRVAASDRFTVIGWGEADRGTQQVWVVLFARTAVEDLSVEERDGRLLVTGRLGPAWAAVPWLDAGSGSLDPAAWDPSTRRFAFLVPLVDGGARILLGCRDRYGDRQATDSVTWPRGTGSPAAAGRSPAPGPPP